MVNLILEISVSTVETAELVEKCLSRKLKVTDYMITDIKLATMNEVDEK